MKKRLFVFALLTLTACETSSTSPGPDPEFEPDISAANILQHIGVLADDSMLGRRAGSTQELLAAGYVRGELVEYGFEPGAGASFFQTVAIPAAPGDPSTSQNVLGVLPGRGGLADEWIVLGAHYDHIGYSADQPDSVGIYNGADDNASGTALLLELARNLAEYAAMGGGGADGRRSIMVHAYGAEELGLLGSVHFCQQPTVSMSSIVTMLNFDMVGRLGENGLYLIGITSSDDWLPLLEAAATDSLAFSLNEGLMNRSDQACFYQARKPVLFFHTGLHDQYHSPYDDVEFIDTLGIVEVGELAAVLVVDLAERPDPPVYRGP